MAGRLARLQEDVQATLLMAVEYARAHTVAVLIDLDVSVNGVDDDEGLAPLMLAAMNGHTDTVSELVGRHNANVEAVDRRGRTSLMLAAMNGHTDAVNALAGTHNANVEAAYAFGNTALMLAAENGHTDTVNVLVGTHNANGGWQLGDDVDAVDACCHERPQGHRERPPSAWSVLGARNARRQRHITFFCREPWQVWQLIFINGERTPLAR